MECCGWTGRQDWNGNQVIENSSQLLFPCSCQNVSTVAGNFSDSGFCEAQTTDWPVYDVVTSASSSHLTCGITWLCWFFTSVCVLQGCADSVEAWLLTNIGVVLGICLGVALIEVQHTITFTSCLHRHIGDGCCSISASDLLIVSGPLIWLLQMSWLGLRPGSYPWMEPWGNATLATAQSAFPECRQNERRWQKNKLQVYYDIYKESSHL